MNTERAIPWTTPAALFAALALACGGPSSSSPATGETEATSSDATATAGDEAAPEEAAWVDGQIRLEEPGLLLPPMPTAVTSFGAAVAEGNLYTLGGYAGEPHAYSREYQSALLQRLPLDGSGGWETIGRLPHGLQGLELVAHDGRVCRVGGNRALNAEGEDMRMVSVDEAGCFDLAAGDWAALPALPEGRSSHAAAVVGDFLWVAGGWTLTGDDADDAQWASTVLGIDLAAAKAAAASGETPRWKSVTAPFQRRALGAASAGGKLVVVGGMESDRGISARVDVFDPAAEAWSRGPDFPGDAFGLAAVGAGNRVYASGRDGVVYAWELGSDAWAPVRQLAFPRFFHELVPASGNALVAVGGISGMHTHGRTRYVERLPLEPAGDRAVASTWTVSYPGVAKNRQGWFRRGDFLYAFGGNDSLGQHDFEPENFEAAGWRFHVPSSRWQRVADFPVRRQSMQTIVVAGTGYAVGGFGHEGHDGGEAVSHPDVYAYDFEEDAWNEVPGLPRGRTQFGLTETAEGDLWIFGGLNYDPAREGRAAFDHVVDVLRKPTGDETAEPFRPVDGIELPGPRRAFSGAKLGARYYLIGGMREGFQLVDDCVAFDVDAQRFDQVACPHSGARLSGEMVPVGDDLVLVGGSVRTDDGMKTERSVERYDAGTDTWKVVLDELPFDPRHARAMPWDDERVLVVSTHNDDGLARFALVDVRGR